MREHLKYRLASSLNKSKKSLNTKQKLKKYSTIEQKNLHLIESHNKQNNNLNKGYQCRSPQLAIFCLTLLQVQKMQSIQDLKRAISLKQQSLFKPQKQKKLCLMQVYNFILIQLNIRNSNSHSQNQILIYYVLSSLIDQDIVELPSIKDIKYVEASREHGEASIEHVEEDKYKQQLLKIINDLLVQFYRQKKSIEKYFQVNGLEQTKCSPKKIKYQIKKMFQIISYGIHNNSGSQSIKQISLSKFIKFINKNLKLKNSLLSNFKINNQKFGLPSSLNKYQNINSKLKNISKLSKLDSKNVNFKFQLKNFEQIIYRLLQNPKQQIKNSSSLTYRQIYRQIQRQRQFINLKQNIDRSQQQVQNKLVQFIWVKKQAQQHFNSNKKFQIKQTKSKKTSQQTTARCNAYSPSTSTLTKNNKSNLKLEYTPIKNIDFNLVDQKQNIQLKDTSKYTLQGKNVESHLQFANQPPSFSFQSKEKYNNSNKNSSITQQTVTKMCVQKKHIKFNKQQIVTQLLKIRQLRRNIHNNIFTI